jgi:pilus assembly protein Flp/PilA
MMPTLLRSFLSDDAGATAVEYGLLAVLISVGLLTGLTAFSDQLHNTFATLDAAIRPKN